jgi:hypothetical protein
LRLKTNNIKVFKHGKKDIRPITAKSIESVPRAIIFDDSNINKMLQEQSRDIKIINE